MKRILKSYMSIVKTTDTEETYEYKKLVALCLGIGLLISGGYHFFLELRYFYMLFR